MAITFWQNAFMRHENRLLLHKTAAAQWDDIAIHVTHSWAR